MVLSDEASKTVIEKFPDLQKSKHWEDYYLYYLEEEEYKYCAKAEKLSGLMTALGMYVSYILNQQEIVLEKQLELKEIFLLIEFFLNEGDQDVQNAAATCFLEGLINFVSHGRIVPERLTSYLIGEKSIEYCKAWDEFTGVKTPGLWSEGEEFDGQFKKWIQSHSK